MLISIGLKVLHDDMYPKRYFTVKDDNTVLRDGSRGGRRSLILGQQENSKCKLPSCFNIVLQSPEQPANLGKQNKQLLARAPAY